MTAAAGETWAADVPVSRPEAPSTSHPVQVDFEGFGFTVYGMVHNVTEEELEEMMTPTFAPQHFGGASHHQRGQIKGATEGQWEMPDEG